MQLDGLAKKLEAERAATLVNSGIDKAPEAYSNAETDMRHEIEALCVITVRAPAGITLKVKATAAAIPASSADHADCLMSADHDVARVHSSKM